MISWGSGLKYATPQKRGLHFTAISIIINKRGFNKRYNNGKHAKLCYVDLLTRMCSDQTLSDRFSGCWTLPIIENGSVWQGLNKRRLLAMKSVEWLHFWLLRTI